jgi:predicted nucleotide-binding protein
MGSELAPIAAVAVQPAEERPRSGEFAHESSTGCGSSLPIDANGPRAAGRIFLVHGRDQRLMRAVAGLLERTGESEVTIPGERPDGRRALVESCGETAPARRYAVVLLTADDVGAARLDSDREPYFSTRARQRVVFEMGVLVAALTPRRVCVLYEEGVELPCDLDGIAYVRLDRAGTWQSKLLLHLRGAGFEHDLNRLAPVRR